MKRLAVARLWHEGNAFSPVATTTEDVHTREWVAGAEAVGFTRGSATEIGAAFGPLCRAIIDVDAPGPACLDLSLLPFEHAPGLAQPAEG